MFGAFAATPAGLLFAAFGPLRPVAAFLRRPAVVPASIPSPSRGVLHLGPFPLRAYALCILLGIFAAIAFAGRRWVARGGERRTISDIAVWAVPGGLVGARLYHVATDYQLYTDDPLGALRIWDGGLGIWGGVAGGALTGWWVARRWNIDFWSLADAVAPALALAQAIGRWGNWFNQELFGRPTSLPWGLEIDPSHRPREYASSTTFHPTFLYESLWNLVVVGVVLAVEKRVRLRKGRLFAVYVAAYTFGRFWIELLRVDPAHKILGLRVNDWTSVVVFVVAMAFVVTGRERDEPEPEPEVPEPETLETEAPAPMPVGVGAPLTGSGHGEGGRGQDRHQVEEGVGEDRRPEPPQAHGDAEDHAPRPDARDHRDVVPPEERIEMGQAEEDGLDTDRAGRAQAVEEGALQHAPEVQLLHDRRADHGEKGDDDEAGDFWAELPEDLVVPAPQLPRDDHDGRDHGSHGDTGGQGHQESPSEVGPVDAQVEVAGDAARPEPAADDPARPQEAGPQTGLADHQAPDPGEADRPAAQVEEDRGGQPRHEPDDGDHRGLGR
jgi:prolipoprotein diacylglyceryl transferase